MGLSRHRNNARHQQWRNALQWALPPRARKILIPTEVFFTAAGNSKIADARGIALPLRQETHESKFDVKKIHHSCPKFMPPSIFYR
jgi:hypothetical protein